MKVINKIFNVMDWIAKIICAVCAFGFFSVIIFQVVARFFLHLSCNWSDEVCRYLFVVMVYSGAVLAVNENGHFSIDVVDSLLPKKAQNVLKFVVYAISIAFLVCLAKSGTILMAKTAKQFSTTLKIPMARIYLVFPISSILMIFYTIRVAVRDFMTMKSSDAEEGDAE